MPNELKNEKKKLNPFLWFLFAIVVPVIIAVAVTAVGFAIAGVNVLDWTKDKANNIPVVQSFITTDEEQQLEKDEEKINNLIANKDEEIQVLTNEVSTLEGTIDQLEREILKLENNMSEVPVEESSSIVTENDSIKEISSSFADMDNEQAAKILEDLDSNHAVAILRRLSNKDRGTILEAMETSKAVELTNLFLED